MNSCLYRATVMHNRLSPKPHRFHYGVFMFYIDLDEIELLNKKFSMFSRNRFNFFSFRDKDHVQFPAEDPDRSKTTKQHILDHLSQNGIDLYNGRIMLLTNLNVFGYNFNPVSFYYCFDEKDEIVCCIAEISNTFREMKIFLIRKENLSENKFQLNTKKYFYVSPFIDPDTDFDFNLTIPGEKLNIKIDDFKDGERFFISTLTGARKAFSSINLLKYSIRFPLITVKVITLIHWNALLLWLKKIPYHPKSANQNLQKDVYRKYKPKT
jgi:uncharacterized protein